MTKEERIAKAVALFKEGYNCSQSVVGAYADLYGFTPEQAFRMSASFGAGIGRMRMTCGAACGMFLLAGLERSAVVGADRASKSANYALVQELAAKFKEQTGTLLHVFLVIFWKKKENLLNKCYKKKGKNSVFRSFFGYRSFFAR